jgi:small subunit ribosomal protein S16
LSTQNALRLTFLRLRLIIADNMVKIRLQRVGAKRRPSYRVVVMNSQSPRDGAYIARIGHYDPLTDPETVQIDKEQALKWLQQGAQPSPAVARLLSNLGITAQPQNASSAAEA